MADRDRLIELLHKAEDICDSTLDCDTCKYVLSGSCKTALIVDYLLANDFTKVVRCKDCRHWGGVPFGYVCRRFSGTYIRNETRADDFCGYGELKEREG